MARGGVSPYKTYGASLCCNLYVRVIYIYFLISSVQAEKNELLNDDDNEIEEEERRKKKKEQQIEKEREERLTHLNEWKVKGKSYCSTVFQTCICRLVEMY